MKKIKETEKGFYGCYWPLEGADSAMIAMLGDDCEDYMAKSVVKWLQKKFGISVLTLSPAHKDYSHINLPVERIGASIEYLKTQGIKRFAITGASTTGMFSLVAASYYPEITLTIASLIIICVINHETTFWAGAYQSYIFFNAFSLFDAAVIDTVWFCHSKFWIIPGTEDMTDVYHDYWFHWKPFFAGLILIIPLAIIIGGLTASIGLFM